jgi:nucleoside-diphosphate-sugar epimerase
VFFSTPFIKVSTFKFKFFSRHSPFTPVFLHFKQQQVIMRVFVTGASGWMGSAILPELINAGHHVIGLARSDASAKAIEAVGAEVHRGDLEDLESLKSGAAKADGVIHLAFIHDFSIYAKAAETDRLAIEALGNELVDSGKPFVVTSGTMMLPRGTLATEETLPDMTNPMTSLRGRNEAVALAFASRGVRVSIVRLPPVKALSFSPFTILISSADRPWRER